MKALSLSLPKKFQSAEHTESLQIKDPADKMPDCYQSCKWGSQVSTVIYLLTALFISCSFKACFSWIASCLSSELQSEVCKTPKGQRIVDLFFSERLNWKEEKIKVAIFCLKRMNAWFGWLVPHLKETDPSVLYEPWFWILSQEVAWQ